MAYSKDLAKKYATNRNKYRSSDKMLLPFLRKVGIKGKVILDFGCGDGPETEKFIRMKAMRVVGVDPSGEMIKLAKLRKLKDTTFIKNDGKTLPLKDNQFDLVYSRFVLHYIKNLKLTFREVSRVLKPEGYFIALFQCLTDNSKFINKPVPIVLGRGEEITKINILSKSVSDIKKDLIQANLKIVKLIEVRNTDASINQKYKNIFHFKNRTYILYAQRV